MTTLDITLAVMLISGLAAWRRYVTALREFKAAEVDLERLTEQIQGARPEEGCEQ